MKKPFIMADVRDLEAQLNREEITYSRFVERLNEMAEAFYKPANTGDMEKKTAAPHFETCIECKGNGGWDVVNEAGDPSFERCENCCGAGGLYLSLEPVEQKKPAPSHSSEAMDKILDSITPEEQEATDERMMRERFCGCKSGEDCNADCVVPAWIAKRVLAARDAHIKGDYDEVWHQIYSIANPDFDSLRPWEDLEQMANPPQ